MSMAVQPKVLRSLKSLKLTLYQFNVTSSNWFAKASTKTIYFRETDTKLRRRISCCAKASIDFA